MAQPSKKTHIAKAALPLFLEHGIKGTSIDMVVRACGASKPTVYNHFPDKSHLMSHVIELWLASQPAPTFRAKSHQGLIRELPRQWLNPEAVRLYALMFGERTRAEPAAQAFFTGYDANWRLALTNRAQELELDPEPLNQAASHALLLRLATS